MKNFEKWEKELLSIAEDCKSFGVKFGKPKKCSEISCSQCDLSFHKTGIDGGCDPKKVKWLYSEYVEKPELTKQEAVLVKLLQENMYLARDRNGAMFCYDEKPKKYGDSWCGNGSRLFTESFKNVSFSFIREEDEEPWGIKSLLSLGVMEE